MSFNFALDPERIAQRPCVPAHDAKMLVLYRNKGELAEHRFVDIGSFLNKNDLLVLNETRVIPARLLGKRDDIDVELLLLENLSENKWRVIGKPLRRLKSGQRIVFNSELSAVFVDRAEEGSAIVDFYFSNQPATQQQIYGSGLMPIPPYIRGGLSDEQDKTDYQTCFAKAEGSIAAPTASLHFTPELMSQIAERCQLAYLTLHVGLSSIKEIEPGKRPDSEKYEIDPALTEKILKTKEKGGRVIAVGTTVVRALESISKGLKGRTDLFIQPGFDFKIVDAVVTNFHFPGSTHLLLVEAFMGSRELIERTYSYALDKNYRFLSYGDGMLIL